MCISHRPFKAGNVSLCACMVAQLHAWLRICMRSRATKQTFALCRIFLQGTLVVADAIVMRTHTASCLASLKGCSGVERYIRFAPIFLQINSDKVVCARVCVHKHTWTHINLWERKQAHTKADQLTWLRTSSRFISKHTTLFADPWFILETNYDNWNNPPFYDDRRTPGKKCMTESGQKVKYFCAGPCKGRWLITFSTCFSLTECWLRFHLWCPVNEASP